MSFPGLCSKVYLTSEDTESRGLDTNKAAAPAIPVFFKKYRLSKEISSIRFILSSNRQAIF